MATTTICSVYFNKCGPARRVFSNNTRDGEPTGGLTTYEIEAAPRGEFRTLKVHDAFQREYVGNKVYMPVPVPGGGKAIAHDIVREFADGTLLSAFGGPGVFVCAGDEPTPEELQAARAKQARWCQALINQAQGDWIRGKRDHIHEGSIFHKAAEYMGQVYEWMKPPEQIQSASCPYCGSQVPAGVPVCATCGRTIDPVREKEIQAQLARLQDAQAKIEAEVRAENPDAVLDEVKPDAPAKAPLPPPAKFGVPKQHARV
jgi:hypothetical protein